MRPVRSLFALVGAAALLVACGDSETPPAAVVDGTEIDQQSVVNELEAIAGNTAYLDALEQAGVDVLGEGEGNFTTAFASEVLSRQIQYTIVLNEVARREIAVDDACRAAARDEVVRGMGSSSASGDGEAIFEEFPETYRDQLIAWNAGVLALQGDLAGQPCISDDAVETYFAEHEGDFTDVCARHILVATREEADAIVTELAAGADFATIAAERSTDTGSGASGGDLGCAAAGGYVPEFRDAVLAQELGEVGEPVESQFGFHVIIVDSREEAELDDAVREQVVSALAQEVQAGFGEWFSNALAAAEVTVDSRYGTWNSSTAQIERPSETDTSDSTDTTGAVTDPTDG